MRLWVRFLKMDTVLNTWRWGEQGRCGEWKQGSQLGVDRVHTSVKEGPNLPRVRMPLWMGLWFLSSYKASQRTSFFNIPLEQGRYLTDLASLACSAAHNGCTTDIFRLKERKWKPPRREQRTHVRIRTWVWMQTPASKPFHFPTCFFLPPLKELHSPLGY